MHVAHSGQKVHHAPQIFFWHRRRMADNRHTLPHKARSVGHNADDFLRVEKACERCDWKPGHNRHDHGIASDSSSNFAARNRGVLRLHGQENNPGACNRPNACGGQADPRHTRGDAIAGHRLGVVHGQVGGSPQAGSAKALRQCHRHLSAAHHCDCVQRIARRCGLAHGRIPSVKESADRTQLGGIKLWM